METTGNFRERNHTMNVDYSNVKLVNLMPENPTPKWAVQITLPDGKKARGFGLTPRDAYTRACSDARGIVGVGYGDSARRKGARLAAAKRVQREQH